MAWQANRQQWATQSLLAATVASMTLLLQGCNGKSQAAKVPPPPTVVVTEVKRMDMPLVISSTGTTRAVNQVTISARVKGFLKEIHFKEGADVKAGQLLFVIDEVPFQVTLAQSLAQRDEAAASVAKAEQSKAREIAQATLDLALAALLLDKVQEQRSILLYGRNAASKGDLDLAEANRKKSEAQVSADRASLEQSKADYTTNMLAAKSKLEQAKAVVRDSEINLGYCRMVSPIDGRIGEALVKVGNLVGSTQDTALATVQQLDPISVAIEVSSRYLPRVTKLVKDGLEISIDLGADRLQRFTGMADFIDNTVSPTTSTFLLKAKVPNVDRTILPGEYVRTYATVEQRKGVLVIPEKALVETQDGKPIVYTVGTDGKVARVTVIVASDTFRGLKVVDTGLEAGQKVIVEGLQLVRSGQPVKTDDVPFESLIQPNEQSPAIIPISSSKPVTPP